MGGLDAAIPKPSAIAADHARARQQQLTKPPGSLGRLERLAVELAAIQDNPRPSSRPAAALVFAADHPVAGRGVSAYPQEVTAAMVHTMLKGGAAVHVLCRTLGMPLTLVDVGVAHPYTLPTSTWVQHLRHPVADAEEGDIVVADAMPEAVAQAALEAGHKAVAALAESTRVVVLAEMGIANTTLASAITAQLLDAPVEQVVGAGTGLNSAQRQHKQQCVQQALTRVRSSADAADPWQVLCALGGREIAALVGAALQAAQRRIAVLVDGFIVSAAMLLATRLYPQLRPYLIFAHRSQEPGHALILHALEAQPLLDLELRLGEGSGALSAMPLLDLACALHNGMSTFAEAAVPEG